MRKALSRSERNEHKKAGQVSFDSAAQLAATHRAALQLRCTYIAVGLEPTWLAFPLRCGCSALALQALFGEGDLEQLRCDCIVAGVRLRGQRCHRYVPETYVQKRHI
jgi:hypothetical protein